MPVTRFEIKIPHVSVDPELLADLLRVRQGESQKELQRQILQELRRANELERRKCLPIWEQQRLARQDLKQEEQEHIEEEADKKEKYIGIGAVVFVLVFILTWLYCLFFR